MSLSIKWVTMVQHFSIYYIADLQAAFIHYFYLSLSLFKEKNISVLLVRKQYKSVLQRLQSTQETLTDLWRCRFWFKMSEIVSKIKNSNELSLLVHKPHLAHLVTLLLSNKGLENVGRLVMSSMYSPHQNESYLILNVS
jgi:hypothetical protein